MNTWNDIYDFSERILKQILRRYEKDGDRQQTDEFADVYLCGWKDSQNLNNRLLQQLQYDPALAYRKLRRHRQRKRIKWYGVAAGILLVIGMGLGWLRQNISESPDLCSIQPGSKKAVLTLPDGSVWNIGDSAMLIATASDERIRVDSNGLYLEKNDSKEGKMHTLTVPKGGEFNLTLSDGTKVWLNSESELSFPMQFITPERKVILTGEAYFEVTKNAESPFIVELRKAEVEVLGTSFNIRSYPDESEVTTTLVEGSVRFAAANQLLTLAPGEQSILASSGQLSKQEVDVYPYVAWKEGKFIFRKKRLADIMAMVSRWYNVEVLFEDNKAKEISFSGGIMRYDGFEALVEMIEVTGSVECVVKNNTIIISSKK